MSLELLELLSGMAQLMSLPDWLLAPLQAENFIDRYGTDDPPSRQAHCPMVWRA